MDHYTIYCDGACSGNPGPGGWGSILILPNGKVKELSGSASPTTNNKMELTAALESLKKVSNGGRVIVLTDSVYLIRGITDWCIGWKKRGWKTAEGAAVLNQDIWEELLIQKNRLKIEWRYIRGHSGTAGNERVDQIAVKARDREFIDLFEGSLESYPFDVYPLPPLQEIPKNFGSGEKKQVVCYLSLVDGKIERHLTWKECEARVKGRPNVKFKKAMSEDEVEKIKKDWGY